MGFVTTGIEVVRFWLYRWMPYVRILEPEELRLVKLGELRLQLSELEKDVAHAPKECWHAIW